MILDLDNRGKQKPNFHSVLFLITHDAIGLSFSIHISRECVDYVLLLWITYVKEPTIHTFVRTIWPLHR